MRFMRYLIAFGALSCTHTVLGDTQSKEGRVRMTGSEGVSSIALESADGKNIDLCNSSISKRVGHLSGMKVRVFGGVKSHKIPGSSECFEATEFTVLDTGSGREALVGLLQEESGNLYVLRDDGTRRPLDKVPGGLRKLSGKRVIIDVKSVDGTKDVSGEKSWRVVTYAEHP